MSFQSHHARLRVAAIEGTDTYSKGQVIRSLTRTELEFLCCGLTRSEPPCGDQIYSGSGQFGDRFRRMNNCEYMARRTDAICELAGRSARPAPDLNHAQPRSKGQRINDGLEAGATTQSLRRQYRPPRHRPGRQSSDVP